MIDALLQNPVQWLDGEGPHADVVVSTHCRLARNLADYPFTGQCNDDTKEAIEKRICESLAAINMDADGTYYPFSEVDDVQAHFLMERRLIPPRLIHSSGARGVHINNGQKISLAINGADHITLFGHASGQQLHDIWSNLTQIDDSLVGMVDFTFDEQRGYLTASLADLGTGLKASALLHLPSLTMINAIDSHKELLRAQKFHLSPWLSHPGASSGELYEVTNEATLGLSESEIIYRLVQIVDELVTAEKSAQTRIREEYSVQLEDRVKRALALARNARLLAFDEGIEVLSSLRLGVSTGLLSELSIRLLNETLMASQTAHLELDAGQPCDETRSATLRAELFRANFAENETV